MTKVISNDATIDGLLSLYYPTTHPVLSWVTSDAVGVPVSLSYSFAQTKPVGVNETGFQAMNTAQEDAVRDVLDMISSYVNISFTEVSSATPGQIQFGTAALAQTSATLKGLTYTGWSIPYGSVYSYYTNSTVLITNDDTRFDTPEAGNIGYETIIHEIGHALGLDHPFSDILVPAGTDNTSYTVMSYTDGLSGPYDAMTFMPYDYLALKYLYGGKSGYNTGDTVYDLLNPADGKMGYRLLLDTDGVDTFTVSSATGAAAGGYYEIDLNDLTVGSSFTTVDPVAIENAIGSGFADRISGSDSGNTLRGNAGNDTLVGRDGDDSMFGGAGNDSLSGGEGDDTLFGNTGYDTLDGGAGVDLVSYRSSSTGVFVSLAVEAGVSDFIVGIENLTGSWKADTLTGSDGDNKLSGLGADDSLNALAGDDLIYAGGGADTINAGDGNDTVWGGTGADFSDLGAGNDRFIDDTQWGVDGEDTVYGQGGQDTILGGNGNDSFYGGYSADSITGSGGIDTISGDGGNDTIEGGDGGDSLSGGYGNDRVWGGNGADFADLGAGDDIFYDNAQSGAAGKDTVYAGAGNDTIEGGTGNDAYYGQVGDDLVYGRDGNDLLTGGYGMDTLVGGGGVDRLRGEGDNDRLYGWADNDVLSGGQGDDTLTGGAGADRFVFLAGGGTDRITDFASGLDILDLDNALWLGSHGVLTTTQVVATFADASSGTVVFDFGGDDAITLAGIGTVAGLAGDLDIV